MAVLPKRCAHKLCKCGHKLGSIALRFNINRCWLRFCIVDQIVGPAAESFGVFVVLGTGVPTRRQELLGRVAAR